MKIDEQTLLLMDFVAAMNGGKRLVHSNIDEYRFDFPEKSIVIDGFGGGNARFTIDYRDAECLASISYFDRENLDVGRRFCTLKRGHEGLHKSGGYDEELRDGWFWDDVDGDAAPDPIVVGKRKRG